jgi:hypothetical protein
MKTRSAACLRAALMLAGTGWAVCAGAQTTATRAAEAPTTAADAAMVVVQTPAVPREVTFGKPAPKRALLVGERVTWFTDGRKSEPKEILAAASAALDMEVDDQTEFREKAADTAKRLEGLLKSKPDAVIILTGAADERAKSKEDEVAAPLRDAARKASAAGARVYLVPSSPKLSASMVAGLRAAVAAGSAEFVDTGTEIGGTPYFDAFAEIRKMREAAAAVAETKTLAPPAETPVVSGELQVPSVDETPSVGAPVAAAPDIASTRTIVAGPAATPAIVRMVPPPALKSVDPKTQILAPKRKKGADKKPSFEP